MAPVMKPFSDNSCSIVFQANLTMNGKIPTGELKLNIKAGKGVYEPVDSDTGGVAIEEAIVLQSIIVHTGTPTLHMEHFDGTSDVVINIALVAGHNHCDNRVIPAGTILRFKSGGNCIVEMVAKTVRSSFSL